MTTEVSAMHCIFKIACIGLLLWSSLGICADNSVIPASAAQGETVTTREAIKQRIAEILKQPEFQTTRTEYEWRYVGERKDNETREQTWWDGLIKGLGQFGAALAELAEALLWAAVILAALLLIIHYRRWLVFLPKTEGETLKTLPQPLTGHELRPESLPKDIAAAAWALWQKGEARASLSLLYRGALSRLSAGHALELRSSATEEDCLRAVTKSAAPKLAGYFKTLTRAWTACAYAARIPGNEDAKNLCDEWSHHFGSALTPSLPRSAGEGEGGGLV